MNKVIDLFRKNLTKSTEEEKFLCLISIIEYLSNRLDKIEDKHDARTKELEAIINTLIEKDVVIDGTEPKKRGRPKKAK